MPKEDVIEFPAIADGLYVQNLFQSNMVLQRDRPNKIWGWATADEKVRVTFAGKKPKAPARPKIGLGASASFFIRSRRVRTSFAKG